MKENRFLQRLAQNRPLLFDGAMGTWFASQSHLDSSQAELAVLDHPELIRNIHQAYLQAGAEALKTDTFSLPALAADPDYGLDEQTLSSLIDSACLLAEAACSSENPEAFVFADLGPVPDGPGRKPERIYERLATRFLDHGVDHFLLETLADLDGIAAFACWLKHRHPEAILMVSIAAGPDGMTRKGFTGRFLLEEAARIPEVDIVGFNCLSGPRHELSLLRDLPILDKPVSIMPNAGYLNVLSRRASYSGSLRTISPCRCWNWQPAGRGSSVAAAAPHQNISGPWPVPSIRLILLCLNRAERPVRRKKAAFKKKPKSSWLFPVFWNTI